MRQKRFTPPARVAQTKVEVKTEPVEVGDDDRTIITEQGNEEKDVKPSIDGMQARIFRVKRRRERSRTPEGRDIKPTFPGSRDMPIDVDEGDEVDEADDDQTRAQIPRPPRADGRPVIIRNVVYKVYNEINGAVQTDVPHTPPRTPRPDLRAIPQALPAAIEEMDEDFVPRRSAAPALPQPVMDPEPEIPTLSKPQQDILDTVLSGKSVLIHGSAGTGKSVLIRAIKKAFEARYEADNPSEPKRDPVDAAIMGTFPRMQMTAQERVAQPLPEKEVEIESYRFDRTCCSVSDRVVIADVVEMSVEQRSTRSSVLPCVGVR